MPRLARIEFPGACYHVVDYSNRGGRLLAGVDDRVAFLDTLAAAAGKTGWRVLAFCLAPDHFQLALETPRANLVSGMKWLLGVFTGDYHRRHRVGGPLFRGRYRALVVQPDEGPWVGQVIDYVLLTPARERLIRAGTPLREFDASSLSAIMAPAVDRPPWLPVERILREAGLHGDTPRNAAAYAARLEGVRNEPPPPEWRRIRRGWCFGSEAFKASMNRALTGRDPGSHDGDLPWEARLAEAERIIAEELADLRWTGDTLRRSPKMAPQKGRIASRLRRETVLTLPWIARRLHMGSVNTLRNLLARLRQQEAASVATEPGAWTEEFDVRWD